ncbi:cell wall hydrolase [Paenibacillus sp. CAA11]|uniref:C40 family peptidase n=1 Tax=Paenibacillus sp. CAA11 TaxID=1532905 RepID=UPI000D354524|nr:C40 family peptidase [Paenibacillus sp. CAA11]AWB44212.1 cell wall hydrolase [Paenibacillus sp. CAA11]
MLNKHSKQKYLAILVGITLILSCGACGNKPNSANSPQPESRPKPKTLNASEQPKQIKQTDEYVPLSSAVKSLGLHMKKSGSKVEIGYTDVMYQVALNKTEALSMGRPIVLSQVPKNRNGQVYMTPQAMTELFGANVTWNKPTRKLSIAQITPPRRIEQQQTAPGGEGRLRAASTNVNRDELVNYAKQFMGVKYEFGAQPYEQSHTFDCSSFTQHVFGHFGVDLPRLARDQGDTGQGVNRSELLPGDLIFFTVPGRFQSDRIPGHVGIFIGDGKMIHTWGKPGVQISDMDSGYWKGVRLFMRRVL